jgi:hypothetical protein
MHVGPKQNVHFFLDKNMQLYDTGFSVYIDLSLEFRISGFKQILKSSDNGV